MPNKRDPNKKGVSIFIPKELQKAWKSEAEARGMSLKDYCVFLIEQARKENKRAFENYEDFQDSGPVFQSRFIPGASYEKSKVSKINTKRKSRDEKRYIAGQD